MKSEDLSFNDHHEGFNLGLLCVPAICAACVMGGVMIDELVSSHVSFNCYAASR
jgi:hypothetical protein